MRYVKGTFAFLIIMAILDLSLAMFSGISLMFLVQAQPLELNESTRFAQSVMPADAATQIDEAETPSPQITGALPKYYGLTTREGAKVLNDGYFDRNPDDEILDRRDRTVKHFYNSDGSITAYITPYSQHYEKGHGIWQDIDTRLLPSKDGRYAWINETNNLKSAFPERSDGDIKIVAGDFEIFTWQSQRLISFYESGIEPVSNPIAVACKTTENNIVYSGTYPGIEEHFEIKRDRIEHEIILIEKPAFISDDMKYISFLEKISLPDKCRLVVNSQTVSGNIRNAGKVFIVDDYNMVVAQYVVPIIYDSSPAEDFSNSIYVGEYYVNRIGELEYEIGVMVPIDYLNDSERIYPVVIDPTIQRYATAGGHIYKSTTPTTTYTQYVDEVRTWRGEGGSHHNSRAYLCFNISTIPADALLTPAADNPQVTLKQNRCVNCLGSQDITVNKVHTENYYCGFEPLAFGPMAPMDLASAHADFGDEQYTTFSRTGSSDWTNYTYNVNLGDLGYNARGEIEALRDASETFFQFGMNALVYTDPQTYFGNTAATRDDNYITITYYIPSVYYVRTDGSDSNAGTGPAAGQAFQTINHATSVMNDAGDIVYVAPGTYTDEDDGAEITFSGNSSSHIFYIADTDGSEFSDISAGAVIIDCGGTGDNAFYLDQVSYIDINGFTIKNTNREGILFEGACTYNVIDSCTIIDSDDEGILLDTDASGDCSYNEIKNCVIINAGYHGITLKGTAINGVAFYRCNYNKIHHNCILNADTDGIKLESGYDTWSNPAGDYENEYNEINDNTIDCNRYGIYAYKGIEYLYIYNNKVSTNDGTGLYFPDAGFKKMYMEIYNNMVFDSEIGLEVTYGGNNYCHVYYNSFYSSGTCVHWGFAEIGDGDLVEIQNNIFYTTGGNSDFCLFVWDDADMETPTIDYNHYYKPNTTDDYAAYTAGAGMDYDLDEFTDWKADYGFDIHSTWGTDPQYLTATELHLQSTSPCIGQATPLGTPYTTDIDADARDGSTPDIGADEYDGDNGPFPIGYIWIQPATGDPMKLRVIDTTDAIGEDNGVIKVQINTGTTGAAHLVDTTDTYASPVRINIGGAHGIKAWRKADECGY